MSNIQERDFTDYVELLPLQFKDSENLIILLDIYLEQVEQLNKAQQELSTLSTNIDTSEGYQLDLVGNLLGAYREGRGDSEYRDYIRFVISVNTGSGSPEDVISFAKTVTKSNRVRYWEDDTLNVIIEVDGKTIPSNLTNTIDNVTPVGVKMAGTIVIDAPNNWRPCRLSDIGTGNVFEQYSVLPSVSEVYVNLSTLAGQDSATAGDPSAIASGLAIKDGAPTTGVPPNVKNKI